MIAPVHCPYHKEKNYQETKSMDKDCLLQPVDAHNYSWLGCKETPNNEKGSGKPLLMQSHESLLDFLARADSKIKSNCILMEMNRNIQIIM